MSDWLTFEKSVAAFLEALDPSAIVTHNARLPDRDTGRRRQRDVWIETRYGGHTKFSILVSCKKYKRKLNVQDVDAFLGELTGSGAAVGVLYSYSGFTASALEKARARKISCCTLYENEPSPFPESVSFLPVSVITSGKDMETVVENGLKQLHLKSGAPSTA